MRIENLAWGTAGVLAAVAACFFGEIAVDSYSESVEFGNGRDSSNFAAQLAKGDPELTELYKTKLAEVGYYAQQKISHEQTALFSGLLSFFGIAVTATAGTRIARN